MSTLKFELVSPERLLVSADVEQVVVPGSEGDFTVLPGHVPAMSTLRPGVIDVRLAGGRTQKLYVQGGFAEVDAASLTVLAQTATDVGEAGGDWLAAERRRAEAALADAKGDDETFVAHTAVAALAGLT
jgi:F-type H+-transporting ATPase subunit epsilon